VAYSIVSTVLSAAASYDLVTLEEAKTELSIDDADTADDAWLSQAITQVSKSIARYAKRTFPPEQLQDVFDIQQDPYPYQTPGGFPQLELSRWPVLSIGSVAQTVALGTVQALTQDVDYRLDAETGRLLRLNPFTGVGSTWEAIPVAVTYAAGYGALVQGAAAVPDSSPYQVSFAQAAAYAITQSVSYVSGAPLAQVAASPAMGQFSVAAGVYSFNAADAGQDMAFTYAVTDIPEDLVEICLRLITSRYRGKDRDPALVQQETPGVGLQRWWFGGAPGQKGPFPPDIQAALDDYRVPTVA
jgi:hypothetical protein